MKQRIVFPHTFERLLHLGMTRNSAVLLWRDAGEVGNFEHHQFGILFQRLSYRFQIEPSVYLGRAHVAVIQSFAY